MRTNFFFLAGWFSVGLLLSNLTYLAPQYFWLCTIAGFVVSIGLCFPGESEILRRWAAMTVIGAMLANNWELLGKVSAIQIGIGIVAIFVTIGIGIAAIGAIGGKNG